ncbi:MAG: radical SAM family heme chaperone HemW [Dermabacter sp.]|nr:radical SAM family heme chaperone HemW [Dermabacter sp.]
MHDPRRLSVYLHVPFCAVRCGYCDFNTYTATELGGGGSQAEYPANAMREMDLTLADDARSGVTYDEIGTVFFGGGTPTLLPAEDQARMLAHLTSLIPLAAGAEITTEANPDSVTRASLARLADAGVTRVSFGMQSAVPRVLAVLDRTHDPESVPRAVQRAREAGLQVSLDMIYGTPTETLADVEATLAAITAMAPDHVSAYSLIVEGNTKMARQLRRGEIQEPDPDFMADAYELISATLGADGLEWYEVSNFARTEDARCRHNLAYWRGGDWWGIGPGAHRHRDGYRAWNVKHPSRYARMLADGLLPVQESERVSEADRAMERLMLELRLRDGMALDAIELLSTPAARRVLDSYATRGLVDADALCAGRVRVSEAGRLMADAIVRDLASLD